MFDMIGKVVYPLLFELYEKLGMNIVTLNGMPKFFGISWVTIGIVAITVFLFLIAMKLLFNTWLKTFLIFAVLTVFGGIIFLLNNTFIGATDDEREKLITQFSHSKKLIQTTTETKTSELKLDEINTIKYHDGDYNWYNEKTKNSQRLSNVSRKYVNSNGKTVKVSKNIYDSLDEQPNLVIKNKKTKVHYYKEKVSFSEQPETSYTIVYELNNEQVNKAKELMKKDNKETKSADAGNKFFND